MGFRICYLAARLEPAEMVRGLDLEISQSQSDMPADEWWTARLIKSGWTVLWAEDETFGIKSRDLIAALSEKAGLFHCHVNETVMWSSSEFWSHGGSIWKVSHAGDGEDRFDLNTEGDPPSEFSTVRDRCFKAQNTEDDVDHVFDIPLELARINIDFSHGDFLEPGDVEKFHVIVPPRQKGLLSRIFGR